MIVYALADQDFARTKSIGIFNLSMGLLRSAWRHAEFAPVTVLAHPDHEPFFADAPSSISVRYVEDAQRSRVGRLRWDQDGVIRTAQTAGWVGPDDWLVLPKGFAPLWRGGRKGRGRIATYVHDVMPEYYRRNYPLGHGRFEGWYFYRGLLSSIKRSDAIFTNSEFSAAEIARVAADCKLTCPPVHPIGIGFDTERDPLFQQPRIPDAERRGIVVLASTHPHKRGDLAVAYLNRFQRSHDIPVDWIGGFTDAQLATEPPLGSRLPRLDASAFGHRLASARAVVYFSEYEGFGMPPVEATLLGSCAVFSDLPPTREVMGECGRRFPLENYEGFETALLAALETSDSVIDDWRTTLLERHDFGRVGDAFVRALMA